MHVNKIKGKNFALKKAQKKYRSKQETKLKINEYQKKYRMVNKERTKEYNKKHNEKYFFIYKNMLQDLKTNGCAICGYDKCDEALDFHHVNPEDKIFHIVRCSLTYSNNRIIDELNKCILLCANCHREIHKLGK